MKRRLALLSAVFLLLAACMPAARAASGSLPSRERDDSEISINEDNVPLLAFPTAEIAAEAAVDETGTGTIVLTEKQVLEAVASVVRGDSVRISVAAAAGGETVHAVMAVIPRDALAAVAEQTSAEVEIITDFGRMALANTAIAAIVEKAGGEDVTFCMTQKTAATGKELLRELPGAAMDVADERIENGSVTEVSILSGGRDITSWGGVPAVLYLPVDPGSFEQGKGYRVLQISADLSQTEHTGRCVAGDQGTDIEVSITHLSTFVVLAGAVEEDVGGERLPMVASPLAARPDGGSDGSSGSFSMAYIGLTAAGIVLAASITAGIAIRRRRKF